MVRCADRCPARLKFWQHCRVRRAEEAGYRSGWRGVVAYSASPWLWQTKSFIALVIVSTVASAWSLYDSITKATPVSAKVLSGVLGVVVLSYLVIGPLFRTWRRRSDPESN